ncbi:MAG: energy transducer TonB [Planctomycetota bacterium]
MQRRFLSWSLAAHGVALVSAALWVGPRGAATDPVTWDLPLRLQQASAPAPVVPDRPIERPAHPAPLPPPPLPRDRETFEAPQTFADLQPLRPGPRPHVLLRSVRPPKPPPPKPQAPPTETREAPALETPPPPSLAAARALIAEPLADNAPPRYPRVARRRGLEGVVLLDVSLSAGGAVLAVEVARSSGHDVLDRAAVAAVTRWRYAVTGDAAATPATIQQEITFALRGPRGLHP